MIEPKQLFSLLSDETRLRAILLLQKEKELCVCEFCQILESSQPKISRHLALLRQSNLICDERRGQWVYYYLHPQLPKWIENILECLLNNVKSQEPFHSDFKKSNIRSC